VSRHWIRRPPRWRETLGAGLLAAGVAGAVFWVTRTLLARELLPEPSRPGLSSDPGPETEGDPRG
jgi:hypothetical protein